MIIDLNLGIKGSITFLKAFLMESVLVFSNENL